MRLLIALTACLFGCATYPPGTPCTVRGDGFLRRDLCAERCVVWTTRCADGTEVVPSRCAGAECTSDDECGEGFACAQTGSVTHACLPVDVCPGGFATRQAQGGPDPLTR